MTKKVTMALETYLEAIAELEKSIGPVNPSVLAEKIGCKRSSVTSALRRLSDNNLINYQPYKPVTLTAEGIQTIQRLTKYHEILATFFTQILCLPKEFAEDEACKLEHRMSKTLIERLNKYIEFNKNMPNTKETFQEFIERIS